MKQKLMLLFFAAFALLSGCKKKPQYSYWTVKGNAFSSNNISLDRIMGETELSSNDNSNRFGITFYQSNLPTEGEWSINNGNIPREYCAFMGFYYNDQFYTISPYENGYLEADKINGKATYHLKSSWHINYDNANDSVLIEGTFNEP